MMTEHKMEDEQKNTPPTHIRLAEIDAQQKIMARVDELMSEAARTKRQSSSETPARPFWAQNRVDIPPSEKFGKLNQMTENENPPKQPEEHTAPESESVAPSAQSQEHALSAIRDEVINKMGSQQLAAPSPAHDELLERIEALEGRVNKHQQDLTALLKLVRQLAAKKEEKPEPQKQKSKNGGWGFGFLLIFLLIAGIIGWLFWLDAEFMLDMMTAIINDGMKITIQLLASLGAV
jgi:hypothetical protein